MKTVKAESRRYKSQEDKFALGDQKALIIAELNEKETDQENLNING